MSWTTQAVPSVATRLNRVYPSTLSDGGVDFVYRVQTQGPWFVATANGVYVQSYITEGNP